MSRSAPRSSYPDLVGFGRRFLDMAPDELRDAVLYQLGALDAFAQVAGSQISYVKPHGALYHAVVAERVARRRARHAPSSSTTRRSRSSDCPVPRCSHRRGCGRSRGGTGGVRRPRPTGPTAASSHGARREACSPTRRRWPSARSGWRSTVKWSRSTVRSIAVARPIVVRAQRHAGRSRDRPCGPRRARRGGGGRPPLHELTCERRAFGPSAWLIDDVDEPAAWAEARSDRSVSRESAMSCPPSARCWSCANRSQGDSIGARLDSVPVGSRRRRTPSAVTIEVVYDGADLRVGRTRHRTRRRRGGRTARQRACTRSRSAASVPASPT